MSGRPVDFSKLRILVVENHALMRRLLREMLRGFGIEHAVEARNVPEAFEHVYRDPFDAVILDFFLGPLDGADFARRVRLDPGCRNRRTPILLITGQPDHQKVLKARDAGIDDMLAKPIAPKSLYWRLHRMLTAPQPFVVTDWYAGPRRDLTRRLEPAAPMPPSVARIVAMSANRNDPEDDVEIDEDLFA